MKKFIKALLVSFLLHSNVLGADTRPLVEFIEHFDKYYFITFHFTFENNSTLPVACVNSYKDTNTQVCYSISKETQDRLLEEAINNNQNNNTKG